MDISKLCVYKYSVGNIILIFSNGDKETINTLNIGSINIEKDFDKNFLPILNISTSITTKLYKKIAGDRGVKANISIMKTAIKSKSEFISDDPKFQEPVITGIFKLQMNNTDLDTTSEIQREAEKKEENKGENNFNTGLDMYLFLENALASKRDLDSMIFCDADPLTVIVHLFQQLGIPRLLVSKPDNYVNTNQIIVPETKLLNMVKSVENIYGVYDHGSILFYDFDVMYYISKDVEGHKSMRNGEISLVNINFEEFGTSVDRYPGSYIDKANDRYLINSPIYPHIQNLGNFNQEVAFNDVHAINTTNAQVDNQSITYDNNSKNKVVVDNKYENPHIISTKVNEMRENYYIVSLTMSEVDISMFTPNKKYYLNFDIKDFDKSRKYTGLYRLSKIVTTLAKNGSDKWFESKSVAFFKRSK